MNTIYNSMFIDGACKISGSKMLSGSDGRPEVGRCCTRGGSEDHTSEKARQRGNYPGFKTQGRCHPDQSRFICR